MSTLFRRAAVESHVDRLYGDILLLPSIKSSIVIFTLVAWFVITLTWLSTNQYIKKETVLGWVDSSVGISRVYPDAAGVVTEVFVSDGDIVKKGQPLVLISDRITLKDGRSHIDGLLDEYKSQRKFIEQEISKSHENNKIHQLKLTENLNSARAELILMEGELDNLYQQLELSNKRVGKYRDLHKKNHVSQMDVDQTIGDRLNTEARIKQLERTKLGQKSAINSYVNDISSLPIDHNTSLLRLKSRLSEIESKIKSTELKNGYLVTAPADGVVSNVQVNLNQEVILTNAPLMSILPNEDKLFAYLLVPVSSSGFIEKGQKINIRYDAFSFQKFGVYTGVIESFSKSAFLRNELINSPVNFDEPMFRIRVELDSPYVSAYGNDMLLKPGMTLEADVEIDSRTLTEWLLDPIYSLNGRL